MPGTRIVLQPPTSSPTPATQDNRFAVRIPGGAKSGFAIINVFAASASTTLRLLTASDIEFDPSTTSPSFWLSLNTVVLPTTPQAVYISNLSQIGEYVKWALEGGSGTPRFSIVLYVFDA